MFNLLPQAEDYDEEGKEKKDQEKEDQKMMNIDIMHQIIVETHELMQDNEDQNQDQDQEKEESTDKQGQLTSSNDKPIPEVMPP